MQFLNFVYNKDNIILKVLNYDNNNIKKKKNVLNNNNNTYDCKLSNNITRARSKILDYCYNNDFKYFLTATINPKYDRTDLNGFIKRLNQTFRDLRKKYNGDLFYLIIPELHKDLKSYHVHGLVGGSCIDNEIYQNQFGYYNFRALDKFGYNSLSLIKSKSACSIYITKYITKNVARDRKKGERIFYCSNGLDKPLKIQPIKIDSTIADKINFDYQSDMIKLKYYFNFDKINRILQEYYKNKNKQFLIDNLSNI